MIGDEVELSGCVVVGVVHWGLAIFGRGTKVFFV
jgi:hypothetical protein